MSAAREMQLAAARHLAAATHAAQAAHLGTVSAGLRADLLDHRLRALDLALEAEALERRCNAYLAELREQHRSTP